MSNSNEITVISSRATDILMKPDGSIIASAEGGPALFIEIALQDADVPFTLHEGERLTVEIEVHEDGEYGRIPAPSLRRRLGEVGVTQWCIVSTLLDEWTLEGVIPDRLMIDIQGYVRDGTAFGHKQQWPFSAEITKQIFCLKGTEEEIGYMPTELVEDQKKQRMLVMTRGEKDTTVYFRGDEFLIPTRVVSNLPDTVGAGDTFFAYYTAGLYQAKDPQAAGQYAADKTAEFLSKKVLADH